MRTQLLIAVSLAISMPFIGVPARQHSHAAGDRPHSHVHAHQVHDHEHEHNGLGPSVAHTHVTLFGVDFTLPAESEDDASREDRCTFLGQTPSGIETDQSASRFSVVAEPEFDSGELLPTVPTFRSIAASAAPLCDTARHERSGVLLI